MKMPFESINGQPIDQKDGKIQKAAFTTTNAGVYTYIPFLYFSKAVIRISETGGANGITCKIYGFINGEGTLLDTDVIAANGTDYETVTDAWEEIRLLTDSTVDNNHGTARIEVCLKR